MSVPAVTPVVERTFPESERPSPIEMADISPLASRPITVVDVPVEPVRRIVPCTSNVCEGVLIPTPNRFVEKSHQSSFSPERLLVPVQNAT